MAGPPALAGTPTLAGPSALAGTPSAAGCGALPAPAPPDLLGRDTYRAATPEQRAALCGLEAEAVAEVLRIHALDGDDERAVRTWDRSEAQAVLFGLVVDAITSRRTAAQEVVADWMLQQYRRQAVTSPAIAAGEQYARWAGRDLSDYRRLVEQQPTVDQLAAFLGGPPTPYGSAGAGGADTGYCTFEPPAPFESEYDATAVEGCYVPCQNMWGCAPPAPSYDQFVAWGEAAVRDPAYRSHDFQVAAATIAADMVYAVTPLAAVTAAIGVALSSFEFSLTVGYTALMLGYGATLYAPTAAYSTYLSAMAVGWEAAGVAMVATTVVAVLVSVVLAIAAGIKVFTEAELPEKIARNVVSAQATTPDLAAVAATDDGRAALFALFAKATLPLPNRGDCAEPDATGVPCVNASLVPDAAQRDPHFVIAPLKGGVPGHQMVVDSVRLPGLAPSGPARTVRLHGNWFVSEANVEGERVATQSLSLPYTAVDGSPEVAWLRPDPDFGYLFVVVADPPDGGTINADTCQHDGACWTTQSLWLRDADGKPFAVSAEAWSAPTGEPYLVTGHPKEGVALSFDANDFAPGGAQGDVAYRWEFERTGCGVSACRTMQPVPGGGMEVAPQYGQPQSGAVVSHVFQQAGTLHARVTATDTAGREVTRVLAVDVASVAPLVSVPPRCVGPCPAAQVGETTTIAPLVSPAGDDDTVIITIDWGDGVVSRAESGPAADVYQGTSPDISVSREPGTVAVTARHAYTQPGDHTAVVTVSNRTGGSSSASVGISVAAAP